MRWPLPGRSSPSSHCAANRIGIGASRNSRPRPGRVAARPHRAAAARPGTGPRARRRPDREQPRRRGGASPLPARAGGGGDGGGAAGGLARRLRDEILAGLTGEATLVPLFHLLRTAACCADAASRCASTAWRRRPLRPAGGTRGRGDGGRLRNGLGRGGPKGEPWRLVDAGGPHPSRTADLAGRASRPLPAEDDPARGPRRAGPDRRTARAHQRAARGRAAAGRGQPGRAQARPADAGRRAAASDRPGGLPARLRAQFGPEAHLAVTTAPGSNSVFVMAARASQENEVAAAVCRRLENAATDRLSGRHPGILAVFLEDLDRTEWRVLREKLELEGAVRRFLTTGGAARGRGVLRVPVRAVRRAAARRRCRGSCASATERIRPPSSPPWPRRSFRQCDERSRPARYQGQPSVAMAFCRATSRPFRGRGGTEEDADDRAGLRGQACRTGPAAERPRRPHGPRPGLDPPRRDQGRAGAGRA